MKADGGWADDWWLASWNVDGYGYCLVLVEIIYLAKTYELLPEEGLEL